MRELNVHRSSIEKLIQRLHGEVPLRVQINVRPMRGGLDGAVVLRVNATYHDRCSRHRSLTFVLKKLGPLTAREAPIYERLVAQHAGHLAPRLLGVGHENDGGPVLYLECVRRISSWPWRDLGNAQGLIGGLAHLHSTTDSTNAAGLLPSWDYEAELTRSSDAVIDLLERCRASEVAPLARNLPAVRRLSTAIPALRRELLEFSLLPCAVIHGDVHPGNALVRRRAGREEAILIDWGRARRGSPLEDLSSWLQSLGYWEPEARRRHDTLLANYLSERGMEARLSSDLRDAYWLAGASNAFSGALEYHLWLLVGERPLAGARRQQAARSAEDWLRIVRRAAAIWG